MAARRLIRGAIVATVAVLAAGCVPPPTGGGGPVPTCPARQATVVETTDRVNYSIVRGVSDNGQWLVTSRTVGDQLHYQLRAVGSSDPAVDVGTATYVREHHQPARVSDDGNLVVWHRDGEPVRWNRSTGTTAPLAPPDSDHEDYYALSDDARTALWESPTPGVPAVRTDTLTDEVVPTSTWLGTPDEYDLVDAAFGDGYSMRAFEQSLDGRWWAVLGSHPDVPGYQVGRWNVLENELTVLASNAYGIGADDLRASNDGSVLAYRQLAPLEWVAEVFDLDGTVTPVLSGPVSQALSSPFASRHLVASPDLNAVAFTALPLQLDPIAQVTVSRCQ